MIITEIVSFDNKRSKVFIDGEFAFLLYKGEIRQYRLEAGEEISSPVFNEIMEEVLPKRAKLRAMNLLQKRDYTEHKLREKLKEGLYPEDIIDIAIDYVKSMKYVDDRRFAEDYIRYRMESSSRNKMKNDLLMKGISADIIESVLDECYLEEPDVEFDLCIKLLKKKHYDPDVFTYEEKQKLRAFLFRKGLGNDVIQRAMSLDTESFQA